MEQNNQKKKSFFSKINDNVKVGFFRWWFVGALYFFIAWATPLGLSSDAFDLVFVLALVIAAGTIFIFNPIVYGMFEIEQKGVIINKKISERTVWQGVLFKLAEFFKCLVVTFLVFLTYQGINQLLIHWFHLSETTVPVAGEPVLYACFFLLYYSLIGLLARLVVDLVKKIKGKKNE